MAAGRRTRRSLLDAARAPRPRVARAREASTLPALRAPLVGVVSAALNSRKTRLVLALSHPIRLEDRDVHQAGSVTAPA
jgi:hypothetical protein